MSDPVAYLAIKRQKRPRKEENRRETWKNRRGMILLESFPGGDRISISRPFYFFAESIEKFTVFTLQAYIFRDILFG